MIAPEEHDKLEEEEFFQELERDLRLEAARFGRVKASSWLTTRRRRRCRFPCVPLALHGHDAVFFPGGLRSPWQLKRCPVGG